MSGTAPRLEVLGPGTDRIATPDRPPLLFVPGLGHGAWCWDHWRTAATEAGYPAYAMSLRGHAGSEGSIRTARLGQYREDVIRVASALPAPPILIGHSMGGLVSAMAAARHEVRGLVLIAAVSARPGIGSFMSVARQHPADALGIVLGRTLPLRPEYMWEDLDADTAAAYIAQAGPESPIAQHQLLFHRPPKPALGAPPILCLGALRDRLVPIADVRDNARRYGADLIEIDGIGHNMMQDRGWEGAWQRVEDWVGSHVAQTLKRNSTTSPSCMT